MPQLLNARHATWFTTPQKNTNDERNAQRAVNHRYRRFVGESLAIATVRCSELFLIKGLFDSPLKTRQIKSNTMPSHAYKPATNEMDPRRDLAPDHSARANLAGLVPAVGLPRHLRFDDRQ